MQIILTIAGVLIRNILWRNGGWLYGALAGLAIGALIITNNKVRKLQVELTNLKIRVHSQTAVKPETPTEQTTQATAKKVSEESQPPKAKEPVAVKAPHETTVGNQWQLKGDKPARSNPNDPYEQEPYDVPVLPVPIDHAINWVKNFFTTGNIIVKVGGTVLFFGIAFLFNYAEERTTFPI